MASIFRTSLFATSVFALAAPGYVSAQTAANGNGASEISGESTSSTDIVVTAQRRQERLVDVPISITVANQAQLERQQVNSVNDLNRIAPSLEIQSAPGQNTGGGGSIRGIGTQTFSPGATASVGVVVDQVSQGNANISDLFDVARIEVLKGPQGTLFGLTTSAGVINITTNAPDPSKMEARVRTELSDAGTAGSKFGQQVVQGMLNVPVSSNAAVRISGVGNFRQGTNRNLVTGKLDDINRYGVRGRFLWEPSSDLMINLIADYFRGTTEGRSDFFTFTKTTDDRVARLASCGITVGEGNQDYCTAQDLHSRSENYGGSLQLEYDAGPFTLTSITGYRQGHDRYNGNNIFRADPLDLQIVAGPDDARIKLFTQEFRVSSPGGQTLEYTVGAFLSHQRSVQDQGYFNITVTPVPGVEIPIVRSLGAINYVTDESMAVFGQFTLHATDALRLIAGGRYSSTKLTLDNYDKAVGTTRQERLLSDKISYRFGLQYDLARNTMAYATAVRGFKGGQISIPALPAQPFILQPEIPLSYEVGFKSTLFGGWVMDLNAFYQKVRNFQAQQCVSDPDTQGLSCSSTNIDGVVTKGAEINFFGNVFKGLTLNTGFIYADASYPKNYVGTDGSNVGGTQLAYAPKYKFTLSGEYEAPLSSRLNAFLAADAVWKSRLRYEANSNVDATFRPHWIAGGRIGVRTADDRFSVGIFARNLFNVHEPSLYLTGDGEQQAIYGPQSFRQVGLQLDAKF